MISSSRVINSRCVTVDNRELLAVLVCKSDDENGRMADVSVANKMADSAVEC